MNNPSFYNARFLVPVFAFVVIVSLAASYQSSSTEQDEIAETENAVERQESAGVAAQAEQKAKAAAAAKAEAEAAEQKARAAAAAKAEAEAAEQKAKAAATAKAEAEAAEQKARAAATAKAEAEAAEQKARAAAAAKAEAEAAEQKARAAAAAKAEAEAATTIASASDTSVPQYIVKDGMVDKATFNGYRRFHGTCHACHGQDAAGGSFAPSLVESLKKIDYEVFHKTVTDGRTATGATGSASVMPAFSNDPNVMKHLDDIYRYLAARADGAIGPGRPERIR